MTMNGYKDLAEAYHKLADVYVYLEKVLEFKNHYHQESVDQRFELERLHSKLAEVQDEVNKYKKLLSEHFETIDALTEENRLLRAELEGEDDDEF